jgi:hypothetical protein
MTQQMVKALTDAELSQMIDWAKEEQNVRTAQRKHETVAKIKELARSVNLDITIAGKRGRPSKTQIK